jgi:hypothetical protein
MLIEGAAGDLGTTLKVREMKESTRRSLSLDEMYSEVYSTVSGNMCCDVM